MPSLSNWSLPGAALCCAIAANGLWTNQVHAQDVPTLYASYAASTRAFKTDWTDGYAPADGFGGNFAKASYLSLLLANEAYGDPGTERDALLWEHGFQASKSEQLLLELGDGGALRVLSGTAPGAGATIDAQAFMTRTLLNQGTVVAIRGSSEFVDFLLDLNAAPTLAEDVTYHSGFFNYAEALHAWVRDNAADSCTGEDDATPLWLTGHSLGGAAATILGLWLRQEGCNVAGVVSFGSPHQGMNDYVYAYQDLEGGDAWSRTHRFVNDNDLLYCFPFGGRWRHAGVEHLLFEHTVEGPYIAGENACHDLPEILPGRAQDALEVVIAAGEVPVEIAQAVDAWHRGVLEFALQCDQLWGQILSLGACQILETTGRLHEFTDASAEDVFITVIRLAAGGAGDHDIGDGYLNNFPSVDFDDDSESEPLVWEPVILI